MALMFLMITSPQESVVDGILSFSFEITAIYAMSPSVLYTFSLKIVSLAAISQRPSNFTAYQVNDPKLKGRITF